MASHGIKDRVAIVAMGCTPFTEHWDKGLDDLIIDAATECFDASSINKADVDAYWLGTAQGGMSGITLFGAQPGLSMLFLLITLVIIAFAIKGD